MTPTGFVSMGNNASFTSHYRSSASPSGGSSTASTGAVSGRQTQLRRLVLTLILWQAQILSKIGTVAWSRHPVSFDKFVTITFLGEITGRTMALSERKLPTSVVGLSDSISCPSTSTPVLGIVCCRPSIEKSGDGWTAPIPKRTVIQIEAWLSDEVRPMSRPKSHGKNCLRGLQPPVVDKGCRASALLKESILHGANVAYANRNRTCNREGTSIGGRLE